MFKESPLADAMSVQVVESPLLPIQQASQTVDRRTRYKLWELQDCWYCMVVGTCLTLAEVRQAASKAGIAVLDKSDYDIHQLAVECAADKKQALAQRLHKLLEKKYALVIKQFRSAKTTEQLHEYWSAGWNSGEVASSLWALITHPMANRDIIMDAFGQVHMLSHLSGASVCVDRQLRLKQECQNSTLNDELKVLKSRYDKASSTIREKTSQLESEKVKVRTLQVLADQTAMKLQELESTKSVQSSTPKASKASRLVNSLKEENRKLRQRSVEQGALAQRQAKEIEQLQRLLSGYENNQQRPADDPLNLCGQCVLYLGGKAQQRRHFQALVESSEGRFLHHDGGRETCPHRITELVSQADVVMCPTDCISHNAMEKARALCAKQDKPIVFMQRASLSSFTRGLQDVLDTSLAGTTSTQ